MKLSLVFLFFCFYLSLSAQQPSNRRRGGEEATGQYYKKQAYAGKIHILASDKAPDSCLVRVGLQLNYLSDHVFKEAINAMIDPNLQVVAMGRYEGITQLPEFKNYPGMEPWWDIHKRGWGAT